METKVLIIGIVKKGETILMRKKPEGSPPYKETWYLFGGELTPDITPEEAIITAVKLQAGVTISVKGRFAWGTEVKKDLDGEVKRFVYLDALCEYVSGELQLSEGIEKLEWIPTSDLGNYDLVPPSKIVLEKLGYSV